jgi:methylthioribose-1-phosphate isomerase
MSAIPHRTVWFEDGLLRILDQRLLPWRVEVIGLTSVAEVAAAIRDMVVRGAGCIGATAGYGMALAAREALDAMELERLAQVLKATRPTAVNLAWAVDRQLAAIFAADWAERVEVARATAEAIADEDVAACAAIGRHGLELLRGLAARAPDRPLNVLTHCNAGRLAFVDIGSATAPVYAAQEAGLPVHVWVDETRPRNQGARLTAWELAARGVPHTVIADNSGGHLMQRGLVDVVITGADRVTGCGDVANKIGTYLKALAARDNGLPFYVALPSSTFDGSLDDGLTGIPIEQRAGDELAWMEGITAAGTLERVCVLPKGSAVRNDAFDVTPARLVTGLITERGVCAAERAAIRTLFPEIG